MTPSAIPAPTNRRWVCACADYDISGFPPPIQVILQAFKSYDLILADNGSAWYIFGVPDERWDNALLHEMDVITGGQF